MPRFTKLTPNLLVASVERSLAFYVDVLGFERGLHVPETPPFVFASVTGGPVEIFLNDSAAAAKDHPELAEQPIGGMSNSMFIEVGGIDEYYAALQPRAKIAMPLVTQWYGMKEFSVLDPDGYMITFAERVA